MISIRPCSVALAHRAGLLAALALWPLAGSATNGYFAHGFSAAQKAMGGVSTAMVEDALAVTGNPAGMALVGDAFEVGLSMFTPIRDYTASERGENAGNGIFKITPIDEHRSQNEYYPLPAISYNRRWGERGTWGIAMYGNGGLNTEYVGNTAVFGEGLTGFEADCIGGFGGGQPVADDNAGFCGGGSNVFGVDLAVLFLAPSVSYRIGERLSVGVSPLLAMSRFAAQGLGGFAQFSNAPDQVTDKGHELAYGAGYRVGVLGSPLAGVNLGLSYQSRVWMSEFDDYRGLFAEQGDFDIPSSWNTGVAFQLTPQHSLALDFQRIHYSEIASVGLPFDSNEFVNDCAIPRLLDSFSGAQSEPSPACLGASRGPGFGWQDMDIWKLGYQYERGRWRYRVGYSQTEQPIPEREALFNVLAPGVIEEHWTAGIGWTMTSGMRIDVALMYAPETQVNGVNPLSNTEADLSAILLQGIGAGGLLPGTPQDTSEAFGADADDQVLRLKMRQYEATIGVSWRY